jgi:hypothetical protein
MSTSFADRVDSRPTQAETDQPALVLAPPAFNTIPEPPGPIEKALLLAGWFLVERFVAVVLFVKKGEFH